nr:putative pan domain-containing protein [Megavirus caiporensis]
MNIQIIIIIIVIVILLISLGLLVYFEFFRRQSDTPTPTPNPNPNPNPTPTPTNCPAYSTISEMDITGFDLPGDGKTMTQDECQTTCTNTPGCNWYNYDTNSKACYLKKGNENKLVVTGFHIKNPATGCPEWSRIQNIDITGFDVDKTLTSVSEEQCQQNIVQNNRPWYSYDHINKICYPKNGISRPTTITGFPVIP